MGILFIADLHLKWNDYQKAQALYSLVLSLRKEIEEIYVLGDLFDYWINNSFLKVELYQSVFFFFKTLAAIGIQVHILVGNRDFLLDKDLEQVYQVRIHHQPVYLTLNRQKVLLAHGDMFCTKDRLYQYYKGVIRSRLIRRLSKYIPYFSGIWICKGLRWFSQATTAKRPERNLAVCVPELLSVFESGVDVIVLGHSHKGRLTEFLAGKKRLYELGAWERHPSFLLFQAKWYHTKLP